MRYDPALAYYDRYVPERGVVSPELEWELVTLSRLVNAFFRWELNSCEVIVKDGVTHPIDYANASPDLSLVSLHYWFPWAITSLVAWCLFCCVSGRHMRLNQATRDYFAIGDDPEVSYGEKLERYRRLADSYFQTDAFEEFRAASVPHLTDVMVEFLETREFDDLLVRVVRAEPAELHELLVERSRERIRAWVAEQAAAVG